MALNANNSAENPGAGRSSMPFGVILLLLGLIGLIPCLPYGEPLWLLILAIATAATGLSLSMPIRHN